MIGRTVGSYTIVDKLGEGGMGEVYLAEHRWMARRAAIKFLRPALSRDSDVVLRFFNEARATSLLTHPGIVKVYDCDVADDRAYIVMEYLQGQSLGAALERAGSFAHELPAVVSVTGQIAGALAAAHAQGIIHRDLKPENIFLAVGESAEVPVAVKILDFGIAKLVRDNTGASHTRPGSVLGTPIYMAPEQCRGVPTVDARADVYSLGCIVFEMVTGRHVFIKEAPGDLLVAHISEAPPRAAALCPGLPPALDELIARMLAKDPAARPASMMAVLAALEQLMGVPAAELASKVPVTSTLVAPPSERGRPRPPRAALPATQTTPLPPAGPRDGGGMLPPAIVGGTQVLRHDSTFRHSASELIAQAAPRPRSRGPWLLIAGLAGAAAVAGAAVLLVGTGPAARNGTTVAPATPEPVAAAPSPGPARVQPAELAEPTTTPPTTTAPTAPPTTPPAPADRAPRETARVTIRIASEPDGAELWIHGEKKARGRTPVDVAMPKTAAPIRAMLRAPGYTDASVSIDPARARPMAIRLDKLALPASPAKPTTKTITKTTTKPNAMPNTKPKKPPAAPNPFDGYRPVGD